MEGLYPPLQIGGVFMRGERGILCPDLLGGC